MERNDSSTPSPERRAAQPDEPLTRELGFRALGQCPTCGHELDLPPPETVNVTGLAEVAKSTPHETEKAIRVSIVDKKKPVKVTAFGNQPTVRYGSAGRPKTSVAKRRRPIERRKD